MTCKNGVKIPRAKPSAHIYDIQVANKPGVKLNNTDPVGLKIITICPIKLDK